jgi:hypothetical protein
MESARNFQAFFIAHLIRAFINLPMPSVSVVLGEGGSGGALAIQYAAAGPTGRRLYATAPPESLAAIIFRDPKKIPEALAILKPTAEELKGLGIIDQVLRPPRVGDVAGFARPIATFLEKIPQGELSRIRIGKLIDERRERAEAFACPSRKASMAEIPAPDPADAQERPGTAAGHQGLHPGRRHPAVIPIYRDGHPGPQGRGVRQVRRHQRQG